jgi:ankyrin repeat protein
VRLLLAAGAEMGAWDTEGQTALHLAAMMGKADVCELLVKDGADVGVKDNFGATPSDLAIQNGHPDLARILGAH